MSVDPVSPPGSSGSVESLSESCLGDSVVSGPDLSGFSEFEGIDSVSDSPFPDPGPRTSSKSSSESSVEPFQSSQQPSSVGTVALVSSLSEKPDSSEGGSSPDLVSSADVLSDSVETSVVVSDSDVENSGSSGVGSSQPSHEGGLCSSESGSLSPDVKSVVSSVGVDSSSEVGSVSSEVDRP